MSQRTLHLICVAVAIASLTTGCGRSSSTTSSSPTTGAGSSSPPPTDTAGSTTVHSSSSSGTTWEQAKQRLENLDRSQSEGQTSGGGSSSQEHHHGMSHGTDVVPATEAPPAAGEDLKTTPEKSRKLTEAEQQYKQKLAKLVLDPALFRGKDYKERPMVPAAYEIAKEHPDVLKRLFCYCGCDLTCRHTSLLDCFTATDRHGATCSECIDEAFLANKLIKSGASLARVQQIVDEQFCDKYPFRPHERTQTYTNYLAHRLYTDSKEPICGDKNSYE